MPAPESRGPSPLDTSPIYLWAALLVGLVIAGLVLARLMGRL